MHLKIYTFIYLFILCGSVITKRIYRPKSPHLHLRRQGRESGDDPKITRAVKDLSMPSGKEKELQLLCKEFCENIEDTECKMTVNYKKYDFNQNMCSCINKHGVTIKRKLFKPAAENSHSSSPLNQDEAKLRHSALVTVSRGNFACNESEISQLKCRDFCKKYDSFGCSSDKNECLCFNTKDQAKKLVGRTKRQLIAETIMENGEHRVGMAVIPPHRTRRPQGNGYGHGHGNQHNHNHMNYGPHGMGMGMAPGCTPYTCLDECPYGCDSLCRQNVECFCSCPEDVHYDYYEDEGFFASLF